MLKTWYFLVATGSEMKPPSHARIHVVLATAKFSGEIYCAACTGKCRGPVARLWRKYFPRLFQCFPVVTRVCTTGVISTSRVHQSGLHMGHVHIRCTYPSYPMTMEWASLTVRFISIVFQTNKRECSRLLLLSLSPRQHIKIIKIS